MLVEKIYTNFLKNGKPVLIAYNTAENFKAINDFCLNHHLLLVIVNIEK